MYPFCEVSIWAGSDAVTAIEFRIVTGLLSSLTLALSTESALRSCCGA